MFLWRTDKIYPSIIIKYPPYLFHWYLDGQMLANKEQSDQRLHCLPFCLHLLDNKTSLLAFEPGHDKTNKMNVCPAKTQISLGIRPVWSVCAVRSGELRAQAFFIRTAKTLIRLGGCPGWSESSLGAQSVCWFCHVVAHLRIIAAMSWCQNCTYFHVTVKL